MIIHEKASERISEELTRLRSFNHTPTYQKAWVHKYTDELLLDPELLNELPTLTNHPYIQVYTPDYKTKFISKAINNILIAVRSPHPVSHGFERGRNIQSFIAPHVRKRRLLTLRLKNAYQRIGKRRVKAIAANHFGLPTDKAKLFAQLVTYEGALAAGNPLSHQILNTQAYKIDRYLTDFSIKYNLTYTRFIDEFVFSSDRYLQISTIEKIKRVLVRNGWEIDEDTVDIQSGNHFHIANQIVTSDGEIREATMKKKTAKKEKEKDTNVFLNPSIENKAEKNFAQRIQRFVRRT